MGYAQVDAVSDLVQEDWAKHVICLLVNLDADALLAHVCIESLAIHVVTAPWPIYPHHPSAPTMVVLLASRRVTHHMMIYLMIITHQFRNGMTIMIIQCGWIQNPTILTTQEN
eukprot:1143028_1